MELDSCTARGYGFLQEVLLRCCARGARVAELPIVFVDRRRGTSKLSIGIVLEALGTLLRLLWAQVTGKARQWQREQRRSGPDQRP